mmetsp:Transcript_57684/g.126380  ORF Transcript_57684/g.126380 Transcript_57684/m.126380 type:complete len:466 (+) Transcript_57684:361-1758(+)
MQGTTVVKNTFIDVEDDPNKKTRGGRRTQTEPTTGSAFAVCMGGDSDDDDDDEEDEPQPSLAYTKTFDPFDRNASPKAPQATAAAPAASSPVKKPGGRARTASNRKVGFFACGGGEDSEDDEDRVDSKLSETQPVISSCKTYDNFEGPDSPVVSNTPPSPPTGTVATPPNSVQPGMQMVTTAAVPMMQQQPQVFNIPIPVNLPAGMSHAVQLPMGLPPGSTIVITPTATNVSQVPAPQTVMVSPVGPARMPGTAPSAGTTVVISQQQQQQVQEQHLQMQLQQQQLQQQQQQQQHVAPPLASSMLNVSGAHDGGNHILPQTIMKSAGPNGTLRIQYIVDARKLKANDKAVISPPFDISDAIAGQYRIIVNPSFVKARGGATFKNSGGLGNVQLKCEDRAEGTITFLVSIGDGRSQGGRQEAGRGPVEHNFADSSVCGLPKAQEEWDFNRVVDAGTKTFSVFLDILR